MQQRIIHSARVSNKYPWECISSSPYHAFPYSSLLAWLREVNFKIEKIKVAIIISESLLNLCSFWLLLCTHQICASITSQLTHWSFATDILTVSINKGCGSLCSEEGSGSLHSYNTEYSSRFVMEQRSKNIILCTKTFPFHRVSFQGIFTVNWRCLLQSQIWLQKALGISVVVFTLIMLAITNCLLSFYLSYPIIAIYSLTWLVLVYKRYKVSRYLSESLVRYVVSFDHFCG